MPRLEVLVGPEIEGLRIIESARRRGRSREEADRFWRGSSRDTLEAQLAQNDAALARADAAIAQAQSQIARREANLHEARNACERAQACSEELRPRQEAYGPADIRGAGGRGALVSRRKDGLRCR